MTLKKSQVVIHIKFLDNSCSSFGVLSFIISYSLLRNEIRTCLWVTSTRNLTRVLVKHYTWWPQKPERTLIFFTYSNLWNGVIMQAESLKYKIEIWKRSKWDLCQQRKTWWRKCHELSMHHWGLGAPYRVSSCSTTDKAWDTSHNRLMISDCEP